MIQNLLLVFFLIPGILIAQVNVAVRDKTTGKEVEGALVYTMSKEGAILSQAVSDSKGQVILKDTDFPYTVAISHLSYLGYSEIVSGPGEITITIETRLTQLEDVVITGQYEPQSAKQSVYKVRNISMERIETTGATRLQDVLNTELNTRFSQDLATGGSNLSLQGLAGQNVKVLIDGVPMVGRQGTGNEININQINVQTIDRIEIVEGPMSVMYGADALAGVINIITKKPEEGRWTGSFRLHEETVGDEYGINQGIHNESISLGVTQKSFYSMVDIGRNYFGGWEGNAEDRDREWHPKTQWFGSALAGYKKNNADMYYRLDYLNENIYNPGLFSGIEAIDQRYITNRLMQQVQASMPVSDRWNYNGALSFTSYTRKIQSVTVNKSTGDERLALGPGLQDETKFNGVTFRGTFHHKVSEVVSIQPGYDFYYESGSGARLKEGTSSIGDYALFISAEIQPNSSLSIRPGIRMEKNTAYEAPPVIPSLNAKFQISERHDLRASYGRGFRAPSIRELYFNFIDASHSIEGNPDLEAELSHSINASWNWKVMPYENLQASMALSAFYNSVENMIGYGVKPGNASVTTYLNIDKYKTMGFTWTSQFQFGHTEATAGISYMGRSNQLANEINNEENFMWSPEVNGSVSYRLTKLRASVSFFYKYTGSTPYVMADADGGYSLNETAGYHWADLSCQKSVAKHFVVSVGIRNLFDVTRISNSTLNTSGVHTEGASRPVGYGRSYFASITYKL